ncbi:MAG: FAD-linked oxidase C-terminal domain-containing protein [Bacteroidota bacterium]|nr:FAD-linked oxidase C-terminal domain-containing protein [Bacteroidota bacterium]
MYKKISSPDLEFFESLIGFENVYIDAETLELNSKDETEDLSFMPEVVLVPANTIEISKILKYCNQHIIPVTTRGAGTGLSGGALPVMGGVVLNLKKLNSIIQIDEQNLQAIVEPGVINEALQIAAKEKLLFYPPDPASKGSCSLGGNIAHSSGGPKAVKYGTTKDYVLNLEVVLANGDIINTGANVLKNSTGYNITQLMVGSEGTLGIVTKIVLKLIPLPRYDFLMLACFQNNVDACKNVAKLFQAGLTPSACEFITQRALQTSLTYLGRTFDYPAGSNAFLLIEFDGNHIQTLEAEAMQASEILYTNNCLEIYTFDSADQKENMWKVRRSIGEAAKHNNIYKEEDTVIPRFHLPELLEEIALIETEYHFRTIIYGHAGDGNLHINILKDNLEDAYWQQTIPKAIEKIFAKCFELGGTISGEHGIGHVQRPYFQKFIHPHLIEIYKSIKTSFDPNSILNPSKIWIG